MTHEIRNKKTSKSRGGEMKNWDFETIYPWLIGSLALGFVGLTAWFLYTLDNSDLDPDCLQENRTLASKGERLPSFKDCRKSTLKKDH